MANERRRCHSFVLSQSSFIRHLAFDIRHLRLLTPDSRPLIYGIPPRQTDRQIAWWLFFTLFLSYSYFYQGGGWSQNSRFDQVRARIRERTAGFSEEEIAADVAAARAELPD